MKKLIVSAIVAVMVLSLFACGSPANTQGDNSLEYIKSKGEIIMGLDDSFPPMGFRDESGELVGFDIDIAQAVADKMGLKLKLQKIDWKTKEIELNNKNIDVIWNGFTITDERKEKLLVSAPYMENKQVIIVPISSEINTLKDLYGKKVAVQKTSSAEEAIDANEELAAQIKQIKFDDNVTAMLDVSTGSSDALAVDLVVAEYYITKEPGKFRILEETLAPEEYGIGFRKGEQAFLDAVMKAYGELKADGTLKSISEKWFGRDVTK